MNPDSPQSTPAPAAPEPQTQPTPPAPSPMAEPPASPAAAPSQMPASAGKKSNKNLMIGILVAVLVIAAGVAYGVYAYVSNLPDNMLKSAVDNLKNQKSLASTFKIVSGTADNGITISGDLATKTDPANDKNGEVVAGIGTGDKRVGINALVLDGSLYLKLANMENLGALLSTFSSDYAAYDTPALQKAFTNVNNQWFELSKDDVKSIAQSSGNDSVSGAVSPEDLKKVLSIYNQHQFIKSDKTYADEVVDGSNSAHFSLKVDKNESVAFLQAVKAANLSTIKVTDNDIEEAKKANDSASTAAIDVWVARDSKQFKQLRVANTEKGSEVTITVTLTSKAPTFDAFQKPTDVKPLTDFTTLLLGSSALMY